MKASITSSPFKRTTLTTAAMMQWVAIATIPGLMTKCFLFGLGPLIQVLLCIITAMLCESAVMYARKRPISSALRDYSALLTGLLLALALPSYAPWWVAVIGSIFAILLVKQVYGGLGHNIFNPAMAAYVFLLISFPVSMTSWLPPEGIIAHSVTMADAVSLIFNDFTLDGFSLHQLSVDIDGISRATPLDTFKTGLSQGLSSNSILESPVFTSFAGAGWQWLNLAYLLGGLLLLSKRIIFWHIPGAFLITLLALSAVGYLLSPEHMAGPMIHLFSGATMLGAFFIITDPVSASTTNRGRLVYGALIATLVYLIRSFGGYPDAVAFAVLLANCCSPLIDYLTQPQVYGYKESKSND